MATRTKIKPSAIPLVLERLVAVWDAASFPPGHTGRKPLVSLGSPGNSTDIEAIIIGTVESTQEWASIGALGRNEEFTIEVDVLAAFHGQQSMADAIDRVFELWGTAVHELRLNPTLGVAPSSSQGQVISIEVGTVKLVEVMRSQGRAAVIRSKLKVRARI